MKISKEYENMLLYTLMLNYGIVPISLIETNKFNLLVNTNKLLLNVDNKVKRQMKRKFRKIWRKICKNNINLSTELCGYGIKIPTKIMKTFRKKVVYNYFLNKIDSNFVFK